MVEVTVALFLVTVAFLPIYSLFSYGRQGAENNVFEVTASNYASDMINFIRDLKPRQLRKASAFSSNDELTLKDDTEALAFFKSIDLTPPSATEKPYVRKIILDDRWYKEWHKNSITRIIDTIRAKLSDRFTNRQNIDSMLVKVEVTFPKLDKTKGLDKVVLYSIVVD